VVGGGDGTYSSIINALIKMKFQPMPAVAHLPSPQFSVGTASCITPTDAPRHHPHAPHTPAGHPSHGHRQRSGARVRLGRWF